MELGLFMYAIIALAITFMFYTGNHRARNIKNTSKEDHAAVLLSSFWFQERNFLTLVTNIEKKLVRPDKVVPNYKNL
jgi:hypothetical protein